MPQAVGTCYVQHTWLDGRRSLLNAYNCRSERVRRPYVGLVQAFRQTEQKPSAQQQQVDLGLPRRQLTDWQQQGSVVTTTQTAPQQQQDGEPPPQPVKNAAEQSQPSTGPDSSAQQQQAQAGPQQVPSGPGPSQPSAPHNPPWLDPLTTEILSIALPMLATLAADPIAGLVDTAYMGRLGATQLAGVGVALSVFNTTTKLFNVPLLSVTTSSVAAAAGREAAAARAAAVAAASHSNRNSRHSSSSSSSSSGVAAASAAAATMARPAAGGLSSAISSSTLIAAGVGVVQAVLLLCSSGWAARLWGVAPSSPLWQAACQFLSIRAVGAPVTVLLLVMQGVYRGLADTRTPFYATLVANGLNVVLGYGLIFTAGWGIRGAAVATVLAQLLPLSWLFWRLHNRYGITFTDASTLKSVGKLFPPTGYLVLRTAAITFTYAIATGLTARAGPAAAACHQVCFQVWLASSLMADSLAVACQTMLAKNLAVKDASSARQVVSRCVNMAGALGCCLAFVLAAGRGSIPGMFSNDPHVLELVAALLPFVVISQPINAMAFVWDGVLFGAGGFRFASLQMALCALPAVLLMNLGPHNLAGAGPLPKLQWVWGGLTLVMAFRAASIWLPYSLALPPFRALAAAAAATPQQQQHQQQVDGQRKQ